MRDADRVDPWHIQSLFFYIAECDIVDTRQYIECPWCHHENNLTSKGDIKALCKKCHKHIEVRLEFIPSKTLGPIADNKSGYWLEWYVWRLLKLSGKFQVLHNQVLKIDGKTVEVDVQLNSGNRQEIAILCDTKNEPTFNSENFYLLAKVFKKLILITTAQGANNKIVDAAKQEFKGKVTLITDKGIESVAEKL